MTGVGSASDPCIVNNYEDFVEAFKSNLVSSSNDLYIEFNPDAENKEIDFNKVKNVDVINGFNFTSGKNNTGGTVYIYGNGWTLKNIWSYHQYIFNTPSSFYIENLNILNIFQACPSDAPIGIFHSRNFTCINCRFSMLLASPYKNAFFVTSQTYSGDEWFAQCNLKLISSSFNIRSTSNDCKLFRRDHWNYNRWNYNSCGNIARNCNFRLMIKSTGNDEFIMRACHGAESIQYCKFSGIFFNGYLANTPRSGSTYKLDFINCIYQVLFNPITSSSLKIDDRNKAFINSDYKKEGFIQLDLGYNTEYATKEQLTDPEFLISKNFPVMSEDTEDPNFA